MISITSTDLDVNYFCLKQNLKKSSKFYVILAHLTSLFPIINIKIMRISCNVYIKFTFNLYLKIKKHFFIKKNIFNFYYVLIGCIISGLN